MQIPDIASREYEEFAGVQWRAEDDLEDETPVDIEDAMDVVDVLWFPTGGGKTEAFLGVAVWSAFFDRLRGKISGSPHGRASPYGCCRCEQMQRMAETMMYGDLVRRDTADIESRPARCFSVGFLVGKKNTPNQLSGYGSDKAAELESNPQQLQDTKVLPKCPVCDAPTEMDVTDDLRLVHRCTASSFECEWQQRDVDRHTPYAEDELPVHIVDNELYRYVPTILAGTIDKITAVGYQRKMAHLITGKIDGECPIHGFSSLDECTEKYGCDLGRQEFKDMQSPVDPYDPAPSIEVPDELHLLEESVGSFDGHYETAVQELQEIEGAGKTKIIAPTATITSYEDQVYHLFLRGAERFPAPGPYLRENFYAQEEASLQRYYMGITPHGKTHINAILELLYHYHCAVQDLLEIAVHSPERLLSGEALEPASNTGELDINSTPELLQMLGRYTTSLTYLLSRKDGDRLNQSIKSQLANYFQTESRPSLNPERMTGGTQFEAVQEILDELESPWDTSTDEGLLNELVDQNVVAETDIDMILSLRDTVAAALDEDEDVDASDYQDVLTGVSDSVKTGFGMASLIPGEHDYGDEHDQSRGRR
ncbi:hypothetical protein [Halorubrum sp. AS12]|uniref:hypothetical protein n=1 Tax=Halorubrum sp. AS12 TaxID=3409687 RepID=UPI003DA78724